MTQRDGEKWKLAVAPGTLAVLLVSLLFGGAVQAYDQYSENDDNTNCRFCHGDFRNSSYTGTDGEVWGNLHNIHRFDMVDQECEVCHSATSNLPVQIGESGGVSGLPSIGCVGCHGRAADQPGGGTGSEGYGLAMQRRHELANVGPGHDGDTCKDCHERADPASGVTPVGENVLPPYYANPSYPDMPSDPCNADGSEDYAGASEGLDNDGDLVADMSDSDCGAPTQTPGEVSGEQQVPLAMIAHDSTAKTLEIGFDTGCETSSTSLHFGPLSSVATYGYSGQVCDTGGASSYIWDYTLAPPSTFFMVVGHNGTSEGSYGPDSELTERPASAACGRPQDLADRCD